MLDAWLNGSPKYRRAMNMIGLLAGFGLGQGSLFAVQTWLLATGEIAYMGRFAIINTMVLLAYQAIDLGGLVILARHVATKNHAGRDIPTFFWSFSARMSRVPWNFGGGPGEHQAAFT